MTENLPLPDYANPPVAETVLGVQFDRLPKIKNAHLALFWQSLNQDEWPVVDETGLIQPQFERFEKAARWAKNKFRLVQESATRTQITNAERDRMIQVQYDRFHLNWLGRGGGDYPRYHQVRSEFNRGLSIFQQYCARQQLGEIRPNQWEITYVNHIKQGTVWETPADWSFFRLLMPLPTISQVMVGEAFQGNWRFEIPDQRGRLHIEWHLAKSDAPDQQDDAEFVRLSFTARGPFPNSLEMDAVCEGLDLGHEVIVRSFCSLMSDEANKYWGIKP